MPIHAFIPYLLSVCATITIKMVTKLSDHLFLNSAVTLTSKSQGQMINCPCLKNAWPDLHETKSSANKFVDLFHIWPRPLTLPLTLTMSFQGQILKLLYLWKIGPDRKNIVKEGEFCGWFDILLIISDLRFTFIVCCSAVQAWRLCRYQEHHYGLIPVATAMVYI